MSTGQLVSLVVAVVVLAVIAAAAYRNSVKVQVARAPGARAIAALVDASGRNDGTTAGREAAERCFYVQLYSFAEDLGTRPGLEGHVRDRFLSASVSSRFPVLLEAAFAVASLVEPDSLRAWARVSQPSAVSQLSNLALALYEVRVKADQRTGGTFTDQMNRAAFAMDMLANMTDAQDSGTTRGTPSS